MRQLIDARLKDTLITDFQNNSIGLRVPEYTGIEEKLQTIEVQPTPQSYPTPLVPFKTVDLSISDIQVGDNISIMADHNIKMEKSFDAISVIVSSNPSAGIAPAGTPTAPGPAGTGAIPPPPAPTAPPVTNIPPAPAPAP